MKTEIVTETGKLRKRFLPAVYFDSSVLIDYWMTEGLAMPEAEADWVLTSDQPYLRVVRDILRSEARIRKVAEIRKKLIFDKVEVTPIVTPLSLLELMEWQAEAAFKQIASEASGTVFIQRKGKKQIGNYLKKALELRKVEIEAQKEKTGGELTGLEVLMSETWLNRSFSEAHGLQGLWQVDMASFSLPINRVWAEPSAYAYLQLGVADIMHILLAQHLGCQYIASFDSDFARVKDIIKEQTGISTLISPEEILKVL